MNIIIDPNEYQSILLLKDIAMKRVFVHKAEKITLYHFSKKQYRESNIQKGFYINNNANNTLGTGLYCLKQREHEERLFDNYDCFEIQYDGDYYECVIDNIDGIKDSNHEVFIPFDKTNQFVDIARKLLEA